MRFFSRSLFLFLSILWLSSTALGQYSLKNSGVPIIEKMTQAYKGQSLSLSQLDKIVKEIAQDGLFQVVYVESAGSNQVVIRAQQSVKIKEIKFEGNLTFKDDELREAMGVEPGQIMSELEITQAIEKVNNVYQSSGYYNFNVGYSKNLAEDGLTLVVEINEKDYCIIEDIQVFSKNDFLNKKLDEIIPPFLKKNYQAETAQQIEKKINDLLLENRFLTAKVQNTATVFNKSKTRVKLKFNVNNAVQYEFVFSGNEFFSHFDLLKESEIGSKFLYLSDSSSEIVETISRLYEKNGFPEVKVKTKDQYFDRLGKRVFVFEIKEGPRIKIGKIEVIGKISREKTYYESLFKEYLADEAHSVYFVKEDIDSAAEKMVTHLKRNGHLQADLLSVTVEITKQKTAAITIQIDEGILTYVRQILFRGSKSFSNIELKNEVKIEANRPLNIEEVENSFDLLETFYKEKGYLEFTIKNRNANVIQYKPGQPYADIVYEVSEGPKIFVKSIKVSGTKKTADFENGDLLTLEKVSNSIDRLEKSGLFGKVNIRSLEQGSKSGQRTIIVEVEERKPGSFSTGIGVGSEGRLFARGYVGTLYNNLWGRARAISSRVDLKYVDRMNFLENRTALGYYEPYLFENRVRGRVSLVRDQRFPSFQSQTIYSTNEIRFAVEKEFTQKYRFTYNVWRFSNLETFQVSNEFEDNDSRKILNIATTGPVFEVDYRNNQFVPTDGSYSRFEIEYADPLLGSSRDNPGVTGFTQTGTNPNLRRTDENNEINYYRATFLTTHYTPLSRSKRWVWANSFRGGYLKNISSRNDSGVPQVRSFYLGGSSTIRGFSIGESTPGQRELCLKQGIIDFDQGTGECNIEEIFIRDDSFFALFKSELRFPISGNFGGILFYDGGAVYLGDFDLEDPYRDAVGIGFSYDTPVGSFIMQIGYKLDRKTSSTYYDQESTVGFHLAIGTF